jgi:C4-dicarboxylate-specific signal transduction histidine kinase
LPIKVTLPDPPLAGHVIGDALRLRQVLTNFLINAHQTLPSRAGSNWPSSRRP